MGVMVQNKWHFFMDHSVYFALWKKWPRKIVINLAYIICYGYSRCMTIGVW